MVKQEYWRKAVIRDANKLSIDMRTTLGTVKYTVQGSHADVMAWGVDLLRRYDPMGYNTRVSLPTLSAKTGRWWVCASRYASTGG